MGPEQFWAKRSPVICIEDIITVRYYYYYYYYIVNHSMSYLGVLYEQQFMFLYVSYNTGFPLRCPDYRTFRTTIPPDSPADQYSSCNLRVRIGCIRPESQPSSFSLRSQTSWLGWPVVLTVQNTGPAGSVQWACGFRSCNRLLRGFISACTKYRESLFFFISQYYCNLSEDFQQSCVKVTISGTKKYIQ